MIHYHLATLRHFPTNPHMSSQQRSQLDPFLTTATSSSFSSRRSKCNLLLPPPLSSSHHHCLPPSPHLLIINLDLHLPSAKVFPLQNSQVRVSPHLGHFNFTPTLNWIQNYLDSNPFRFANFSFRS